MTAARNERSRPDRGGDRGGDRGRGGVPAAAVEEDAAVAAPDAEAAAVSAAADTAAATPLTKNRRETS